MADWEEELGLKNVRPFERPMTAGPNDKVVGQDELGQTIYETATGQRYSVRPATAEESKTTRAKAEDWVKEGAPLPSGEQVLEALKGMPQAAYESAAGAVRGTGTVGEALAVVPTSGAIGAASRIGQAADPNVVSAMGATYRVPRYPKKTEKAKTTDVNLPDAEIGLKTLSEAFEEDAVNAYEWELGSSGEWEQVLVNPDGYKLGYARNMSFHELAKIRLGRTTVEDALDYIGEDATEENISYINSRLNRLSNNPDFVDYVEKLKQAPEDFYPNLADEFMNDAFGNEPIPPRFENPTIDIVDQMEVPRKGLLGAQLIKDLNENPTVRNSQLNYQGVFEQVDPAKRYNKDEIATLLWNNTPSIATHYNRLYSGYQRQFDLADPEVDYSEISVEAAPTGDANFVARNQHYDPESLAHVRFSERANPSGNYLLIEELQSDLLQHGYVEPTKEFTQAAKNFLKAPFIRRRFKDYEDEKFYDKGTADAYRKITGEDLVNVANADDKVEAANLVLQRVGLSPNHNFGIRSLASEAASDFNTASHLNLRKPPVEKTEDTVRLGLQAAMGEASNRGITKLVIPSLEKIVEKRFSKSEDVAKALDPKSGFYATYVKGVDKVLKELKAEYGDLIKVNKINLNYQNSVETGVEIDFSGMINEGYDLTRPRFAEGGMVENIDPISGNEVPLGAKPEEVRDDVPIMASEGEYVLPANVVRYIGLDRIEKMVKQAKKGLEELDAEGRIGGEKATMDEDLPFSPEELVAVEETEASTSSPAMMAEGGLVSDNSMDIDPTTGLPRWLLTMQQNQMAPVTPVAAPTPTPAPTANVTASEAPKRGSEGGEKRNAQPAPTGLSKPVKDWSVEDYDKYSRFRNSVDSKVMQGVASVIPGAGLVSNIAQRTTERNVNQNLTEMLRSGKDLNGKPLSTEQLSTLRETYSKISGEPISRTPGFAGAAQAIARETGLIKPRTPTQEQMDSYNERVQGDSFINRAIDFISGNKKPKTSAANDTRTTDLKEKGQQDRYGNTLVSGGRNKDSDRTVRTPGGKTVTTSSKPTNKSSTRTVSKKK